MCSGARRLAAGAVCVAVVLGAALGLLYLDWAREQAVLGPLLQKGYGSLEPIGPPWASRLLGPRLSPLLLRAEVLKLGTPIDVPDPTGELGAREAKGLVANDGDMARVATLRHLRCLDLSYRPITNDGVARLRGMARLTELTLCCTRLTGGGLRPLRGLRRLERLDLTGTGVSDADIGDVAQLPALEVLRLGGTHVSDQGVRELSPALGLRDLDLSDTKITDAGLRHLRGLPQLQVLSLVKSQVTDVGVAELAGLYRPSPPSNWIRPASRTRASTAWPG